MMTRLACALILAGIALLPIEAQTPSSPSGTVLFEGLRLIAGDGRPAIENAAFLVEGARLTQVGTRGSVRKPDGATVVDLKGSTVMPAIVDAHSHLGYTNARTGDTSSVHYTRDNLLDHLRRYAYFGIAATLSMGLDRGELPYELRAMPVDGMALFRTAGRGIAMPNAGPNALYWRDAPYGITTESEGRQAVRELAAKKVDVVKIWVDDRNKTVTPLPPSLYRPIIEEAHKLGLRVIAHVYYLADAKELLRAGIDGFAHGIRDLEVDDEIMGLFKARPQVFVIPNLPDTPPFGNDLVWLSETLPPSQIAALKRVAATSLGGRPRLFDVQARSLKKLTAAGVRIAFGTDAGIGAPYGWSGHAEMADMVTAGMTPMQVIVAATRTSAEVLKLDQLGTLAAGKSADFIVLNANPLDNITNTRRISQVYLRGRAIDRKALSREWSRP
jgi:imidazolonepropionase-like amidohydrolase